MQKRCFGFPSSVLGFFQNPVLNSGLISPRCSHLKTEITNYRLKTLFIEEIRYCLAQLKKREENMKVVFLLFYYLTLYQNEALKLSAHDVTL